MSSGDAQPVLRISELSRRTGVPVPTIRGWERRYQYPLPTRTTHGYRLYSEADVRTVMQLRALLDSGMAISQAVDVMRSRAEVSAVVDERPTPPPSVVVPDALSERLALSLLAFNSGSAHELLDRAFGAFGIEAAMCQVALPAVRRIGEQWMEGTATIAQEHFASDLVRGRLWSLTRGWDQGTGRSIVLAVVGGDHHDLPLLMLGVLLRERGWRVTWIGANTPAAELIDVAQTVHPELVLVSMTVGDFDASEVEQMRTLRERGIRIVIAGAGANNQVAKELGAILLEGGPDDVARALEAL